MASTEAHSEDIAAAIVRALVLYSLAEFQATHATTIRVHAHGVSFEVSDDGRGHAMDRTVAGQPYMNVVYSHLDFPFAKFSFTQSACRSSTRYAASSWSRSTSKAPHFGVHTAMVT